MKKIIAYTFCAMLALGACCLGIQSSFAAGTTWPVSPGTGNIQAAINGAASGDTLSLATGTYDGAILINTSLTIQAASGATPVVKFTDANTGGPGSYPFAFQASNTTIVWDGINIIYDGNPTSGLCTNDSPVNQNVTFKNCTISDTANHVTKGSSSFIFNVTDTGSLLTFDHVTVDLSAGAGFTWGIYQNSASTGKVVIDNSTMTLAHCAYEVIEIGNGAGVGGQITFNKSTIAGDGAYGLLLTWSGGASTANQSRFNMNSSSLPTGIYNYDGTGTMVFNQCVIDASNSAVVPISNLAAGGGSTQFTNCALLYNSAKMGVGNALLESRFGGIASFKYCTFADSAASGDAVVHGLLGLSDLMSTGAAGALTVQDCLFSTPIAPIYIWNLGAGNANITYTVGKNLYSIDPAADAIPTQDEANLATGSVNVVGDPMLATDNIHLTAGSPAIGVAANIGIVVDIDREARPVTGGDLGCDQFNAPNAVNSWMIYN